VAKDLAELRQLVARGFAHYEHGRRLDALADWETALKLDPQDRQVKRLVEFAHQRERELAADEHSVSSRRNTVESPIPRFLAALTEGNPRQVAAGAEQAGPGAGADGHSDEGNLRSPAAKRGRGRAPSTSAGAATAAADTLEDLPVEAERLRASAVELIGECRAALNDNRASPAALAAEMALQLGERAAPPGLDDLINPSRALFERAFRAFAGNPHACPIRAVATYSISDLGLDERAAFFMSRLDGMTSLAELIDSSGMTPFDAVRLLAALRRARAIDLLPPL
jgi:HPt (histidine-containing phosphotransfer) domain-containing protein